MSDSPRGYRLLFELGRGGMGAAFLARAEGAFGFERLVVIKRIRPERLDARSIERFLREARLAAAIHHANVVSAQNVGRDAAGPYIVLDYVDGASLEELLDRSAIKQRAVPVEIALRIALDTLAGLDAVHQAKSAQGKPLHALHRDVSVQNVLVGVDGVARLLDFGIARSELGGATTDQHYLVGKLMYLPPEYLRREDLAPSADVYALGVTLWVLLTGMDPWVQESEAQLLHQILEQGVPPLSERMQVAPEVVALVARACQGNRAERFQTAREMAAAIETLGRERGWLATHHEVSEWLNELAGTDLARRRERIALMGSEPEPQGASASENAPANASENAPQNVVTITARRDRARWPAIAAALVAAGVLGATVLLATRHPSEPSPSAPSASAKGEPPVASSRPSAAAPLSPVPSETVAAAPASAALPSSAPTNAVNPAATGHAARPQPRKPSGQNATASSPAVHPPTQISKHNPYRD